MLSHHAPGTRVQVRAARLCVGVRVLTFVVLQNFVAPFVTLGGENTSCLAFTVSTRTMLHYITIIISVSRGVVAVVVVVVIAFPRYSSSYQLRWLLLK